MHYEQTPIAVSAVMESAPNEQLQHACDDARHTLSRSALRGSRTDAARQAGRLVARSGLDLLASPREHQPRFRSGRLGSIVDPVRDLVPGSNHNLYGLNTGLAVVDRKWRRTGHLRAGQSAGQFGPAGCWKYDPVFVPQRSHVYVNLFNNQWTTNFRFWNEGTWTSRVRLWPLEEGERGPVDDRRRPWRPGIRCRRPRPATRPVTLPAAQEGVSVSRKGVLVTALGRECRMATAPCCGCGNSPDKADHVRCDCPVRSRHSVCERLICAAKPWPLRQPWFPRATVFLSHSHRSRQSAWSSQPE